MAFAKCDTTTLLAKGVLVKHFHMSVLILPMPADLTKACKVRVENKKLASYEVAYGDENLQFGADGDMTLSLPGTQGTRLATRTATKYGMSSFAAKINDKRGVLTAAYVSIPVICSCDHSCLV